MSDTTRKIMSTKISDVATLYTMMVLAQRSFREEMEENSQLTRGIMGGHLKVGG